MIETWTTDEQPTVLFMQGVPGRAGPLIQRIPARGPRPCNGEMGGPHAGQHTYYCDCDGTGTIPGDVIPGPCPGIGTHPCYAPDGCYGCGGKGTVPYQLDKDPEEDEVRISHVENGEWVRTVPVTSHWLCAGEPTGHPHA